MSILSKSLHDQRQKAALRMRRAGRSWAVIGACLPNGRTGYPGVGPETARRIAYCGLVEELDRHFRSMGGRVGPSGMAFWEEVERQWNRGKLS